MYIYIYIYIYTGLYIVLHVHVHVGAHVFMTLLYIHVHVHVDVRKLYRITAFCYIFAEIVEPPRDTTVFLDHSAVFVCGTRDALYGYWRVNGTAYNYLPPAIRADLDADQETVGDIEVYTLTIPGRAEYNGTEVQCVAGDDGGGTIESAIATLKVQGKDHSSCICLKP